MGEPVSITILIASVGSLIAILCDKMKNSRCSRIICCCCELDREVLKTEEEKI
tara:strand:- start:582 stop:740 length:159 start_codon:yes stop_codon:yes gene_type:complete